MLTFAQDPAVDPTQTNLSLALLDQSVAGRFQGRQIAYTPVYDAKAHCHALGIAERDKRGYWPVPTTVFKADTFDQAADVADGMNRHIGLSEHEAMSIVTSSMRAR